MFEIAKTYPEINIVYPVHLNPDVQDPVTEIIGPIRSMGEQCEPTAGLDNIYLIQPLDYEPFVYLMGKSYLVLTDSGGIQEEAPSLGKPVLVMRDTTERTEGVEAGTARLVGTTKRGIVDAVTNLVEDSEEYEAMAQIRNPYGDGKAAEKLVNVIRNEII